MSSDKARLKAAAKLFKKPRGLLVLQERRPTQPDWMTRVYRNNRVTVMINDNALMVMQDGSGFSAIKAMIQRHDDKPIPNHWWELQQIKNEIFGKESTGIEYYPAESALINDHNIYWLWILPMDHLPIADRS